MFYRTITVKGKEYKYKIGKRYTKIKDIGEIPNAEIGDILNIWEDIYRVTPLHVAEYITRVTNK